MTRRSDLHHSKIANKILFQPWFLPARITFAIHGLIPPDFWRKWRYLFDDYGCIVCGERSQYFANGMCHVCHSRVKTRLVASLARRKKSHPHKRLDIELLRQQHLARKLLAEFPCVRKSLPLPPRVTRHNPVYEILATRVNRPLTEAPRNSR
jgi:hypothetical protein